jgi:hypothetical protein
MGWLSIQSMCIWLHQFTNFVDTPIYEYLKHQKNHSMHKSIQGKPITKHTYHALLVKHLGQQIINNEINVMLKDVIIHRSQSPWVSPANPNTQEER